MDETVSEYGDGIMVNFFQGFSSSGRSGQWREARGENFARNFEERDHQKQRTEKASTNLSCDGELFFIWLRKVLDNNNWIQFEHI